MHGYKLVYEGEDSPKGKTWSITPLDDNSGLWIEYGAIGSKPRTALIPRARCQADNPTMEMIERRDKKVLEGYVIVDSNLAPKAVKAGDASTSEAKRKVIAYADYDRSLEFGKFRQRIVGHLTSVLDEVALGGAVAITNITEGIKVVVSRPEPQPSETVCLGLKINCPVSEGEQLKGLLVASMASAFPEQVKLLNAASQPMLGRELGELVVGDSLDLLDSLGIVQVVKIDQDPALGAWFF